MPLISNGMLSALSQPPALASRQVPAPRGCHSSRGRCGAAGAAVLGLADAGVSGSLTAAGVASSLLAAGAVRAAARRQSRQRRPCVLQLRATAEADTASSEIADIFPEFSQPEEVAEENTEPCIVMELQGEIAIVRNGTGLGSSVKPGATVRFSSGGVGVLLVWKEGIGAIQVTEGSPSAGDNVRADAQWMVTASSSTLRGRILDAAGRPLDGRGVPPVPASLRMTFSEYKTMNERTNQYRPLFTGVLGVDFCVPVGRGQTMLFQGTNREKDRKYLWPDLMASKAGPNAPGGPTVCTCVCESLEEAEYMREQLEQRGCWDNCTIFVPETKSIGSAVIAMNAAVAFGEQFNDEDGEGMVLLDLEPMHKLWNILAEVAGDERRAKGVMADPKDEVWTEMEGTVLRESIAERRKMWFALISRATNTENAGSVSLLAWLWEQEGGLEHRKQKAYERKIEQIADIPRIDDKLREKMVLKIKAEAAAEGVAVGEPLPEPDLEVPGVPNWEIEELKSITDGHILLLPPSDEPTWSWKIDPYKSLPRLGTDAMHPALISVDAHKLRLKMLQARDRANMLHTTLGAGGTVDQQRLELTFAELVLEQPAGRPLSAEEQVSRLAVVSNPDCAPLRRPDGCSAENLNKLCAQLLASEAGQRVAADLAAKSEVSDEARELLAREIEAWNGA